MKIVIEKAADEMGAAAARHTAELLNHAIEVNDCARLILSTGASQFETLKVLVKLDVDWTKVEMFHLHNQVCLSGRVIPSNSSTASFGTRSNLRD